jgi:hypothetical protein
MLGKKRVAVCFSGQLRDWKLAKTNILNYFSTVDMPDVSVDYFIHTWDTNTWRFPKIDINEYVNRKHNDIIELVDTYKPVAYHMSAYDPKQWQYWAIWDPLFYSFEYSILLKKQYELENNFVYDIVIKARPDTVYNPANRFPFHRGILDGSCYTASDISRFSNEFNMQCFDDVMFFGGSKTMDVMSGLYKYYHLKNKNSHRLKLSLNPPIDLDVDIHLGPGTLLYQYAVKHNIHPDAYKIDYAIIRSTMRDNGVDSTADFDKIKKLHQEWYE